MVAEPSGPIAGASLRSQSLGQIRVVESTTFRAADRSSVLAALERLGVERLIRVLPACACVSRSVELPDAPDAELSTTLALLAEAHLPAGIPAHRRAWGVIPGPAAEGHRAALVLGWIGVPAPEDEPLAPAPGAARSGKSAKSPFTETWTSELAALSAMVEPRRSTVAVYADRARGSVALLAWNGTRSTVRAVRETPEDSALAQPVDWDDSIAQLVRDTAGRVGVDADGLPPENHLGAFTGRSLWIDPANRARAERWLGAPLAHPPQWLDQFGVAAAAAALALHGSPASARLVELTPDRVEARRSAFERTVEWLSNPARAWKLAAAALALLLLIPLGTAWARKAVLQSKAAAIETQQSSSGTSNAADELDMRLAMYRELDKRRLPMAKLIADIAGCMPVGVSLDQLQVVGADRRVVLRGKAPDRATLTAFVSKLNASGVFANCDFSRADAKEDFVEFDVSGVAAQPFVEARGAEDWSTTPLAVKLYGEEARKPRLSVETKPEKKPAASGARRGGAGGGRDIFDAKPAAKAPDPVPPELKDADIKAMERSKAGAELASRLKARSRSDIDAATKERLKGEIEKVRARLRELQESPKGGGS
ncbi:MAG: PilN domain-containing protein [Phycisphaerales bacterium]